MTLWHQAGLLSEQLHQSPPPAEIHSELEQQIAVYKMVFVAHWEGRWVRGREKWKGLFSGIENTECVRNKGTMLAVSYLNWGGEVIGKNGKTQADWDERKRNAYCASRSPKPPQ